MAKTDLIQVRISAEDKQKATELFANYGLNPSSAVRMFIQCSLREGRLPFNFEDVRPVNKERLR